MDNMEETKKKSMVPMSLFVIAIILFTVVLGAVLYKDYLGKGSNDIINTPKEENKTEEQEEIETLDINNLTVQKLYSYMKMRGYGDYNTYLKGKTKITTNDLSAGAKLYFGYRLINSMQQEKVACSDFKEALQKNNKDSAFFCGEEDNEYSTTLIEAKYMKMHVEEIYGPNTYEAVTFDITPGFGTVQYYYLRDKDVYLLRSINGGGSGPEVTQELLSAEKNKDSIILKTKFIIGQDTGDSITENWDYTYKLNKDGNYYFESIEKK